MSLSLCVANIIYAIFCSYICYLILSMLVLHSAKLNTTCKEIKTKYVLWFIYEIVSHTVYIEQGWRTQDTREISLECGIHCCANFLFLFPDQRLYTLNNVFVYIYIYITDCVDISYLLWLPPNKTASEVFLQKLGAVRNVAGYLLPVRRPGRELANTWHWTKRFTTFFSNRK